MENNNRIFNNIMNKNTVIRRGKSNIPFYAVVLYVILEYGRPQSYFPVLAYLHLPAITILIIMISLALSGNINWKDKQTTVFMLIMLEMIIHGPIANNNHWAFWVFYGMVINFTGYLGITHFIDDEYKMNKLIEAYLFVFVLLSFHSFSVGGRGVGGFIGDENDFCMVLNMVFPFAVYSIFSANSKIKKVYYIFLSGLFLVANVTTLSRGGFLGLASVMLYIAFRSKNKFAITSIMITLVMVAVLFAPPTYWNEVNSIFGSEQQNPYGTGAQRIYHWKLGWQMFLDHPILGVGQGNYPWNVLDVETEFGLQWHERSLGGRAAHSLYFTLIPELGLVGILLYTLMVSFVFKNIKLIKYISTQRVDIFKSNEIKRHMNMALSFEASLIGFLISSIFISTLYYPSLYVLCGIVLAYKNILQSKVQGNEISNIYPKKIAGFL